MVCFYYREGKKDNYMSYAEAMAKHYHDKASKRGAAMKIKTFLTHHTGETHFDNRVNDFIKDKQVIKILTGDAYSQRYVVVHSLTILYEEE